MNTPDLVLLLLGLVALVQLLRAFRLPKDFSDRRLQRIKERNHLKIH